MFISIDKIIPNPEQPRMHFDEAALLSLGQSIQVNGLIQPIIVEQAEDCYIIHDGERRWRASQLAGLTTIEAIVNACTRLKEQLEAEDKLKDTRIPALALMGKEPKPEQTERWKNVRAAAAGMCDACAINPKLPDAPEPAWSVIMQAAQATCNACSLRQTAALNNLTVCRECPGVELLKRMAANAK